MDPLVGLFDPSQDETEMIPDSLPPEVSMCNFQQSNQLFAFTGFDTRDRFISHM